MPTADIDLFSSFLEQGVDPNIFNEVSTAVIMIVGSCHDNTVDHLQRGFHALFYAIYNGREDLVKLLMQYHADVDLASRVSVYGHASWLYGLSTL